MKHCSVGVYLRLIILGDDKAAAISLHFPNLLPSILNLKNMYRKFFVFILSLFSLWSHAQFNIERLVTSGQIALHYEDYVLSMQYFNQVIALKPYLYKPWQYRAVAKFYLDDYVGAEADASQAIALNPYIEEVYDLRGIARIRQKKFDAAIEDYNQALRLDPSNRNYWFNRAASRVNNKNFKEAHQDIDSIVKRWNNFANAYTLNAEVYLQEKDTANAVVWLDKSLKVDPYDGEAWIARSYIALSRKQWKDADEFLGKAIRLKAQNPSLYINRALARININNLRGAMADYDMALDLDPNNFLGHYNRGLLRMQLGDDNRAILDFDYVIKMEPDNVMAILNRAILHDKTGNLRAAISDYTTVINRFPNFWSGLSQRAKAYRRLGMTAKAEMDEFRILKAQLDKQQGKQVRWSKNKLKEVRKRSEIDLDKHNQIVIADEQETIHEYKSKFRGRIQNNSTEMQLMPLYHLSYLPYSNGMKSYQAFDKNVEAFNARQKPMQVIYVSCGNEHLAEEATQRYFALIDTLHAQIRNSHNASKLPSLVLQRAVAYSVVQNFTDALADINTYLGIDSTSAMGYWHRAVCQMQMNSFHSAAGIETRLQEAGVLSDLNKAIQLNPHNPYLYYNRGNLYAAQEQYDKAIADYTQALQMDGHLAEGYYNRGICHIKNKNRSQGIKDLSKAGELGLYRAYNLMKQSSAEK